MRTLLLSPLFLLFTPFCGESSARIPPPVGVAEASVPTVGVVGITSGAPLAPAEVVLADGTSTSNGGTTSPTRGTTTNCVAVAPVTAVGGIITDAVAVPIAAPVGATTAVVSAVALTAFVAKEPSSAQMQTNALL